MKLKKKKTTPSPEELVRTFESVEHTRQHNGYAVPPYIKGLTEALKRTLVKHDIKVFSKAITTLKHHTPYVNIDPCTMEQQTNIIYKIPYKDCSLRCIGETGGSLTTKISDHLKNVEHCKKGSNVAKHTWTHDHVIDIKICTRKTLESWHTALTNNADSNCITLPRQYSMLRKTHSTSLFTLCKLLCIYIHSH